MTFPQVSQKLWTGASSGIEMEGQRLSFTVMLGYLHRLIESLEEPRQPSNAQRYSLRDIILSAFSVFYIQ
ncbi:MAG: hypothetical protein AAFN08_15555, partial [Cyanobacteria bacterium J06559_3]